MRPLLAFVLLFFAVTPASAGKVNLNPEHGDPLYQAWSILSPDVADGQPYGNKVVVVFHGFRSALPNGAYKRMRNFFKDSHTVVGINYHYFEIEDTKRRLDAFSEEKLKGREVVVFGTSLGALWANYFGNRIGAKQIVVINPVIEPVDTLQKYVGKTVEAKRRGKSFPVSAEEVERYSVLSWLPGEVETLMILTEKDEAMDYRIARDACQSADSCSAQIYDEGGHTINLKKHPARERIIAFVRGE